MTPPRSLYRDPLAYDPDDDRLDLDPVAALMRVRPGGDRGDPLSDLLRRPAWHVDAACRGMDPNTFFPGRGESVEPARAVCATCPVAAPCADAGTTETVGVWGGLSARQRRPQSTAA